MAYYFLFSGIAKDTTNTGKWVSVFEIRKTWYMVREHYHVRKSQQQNMDINKFQSNGVWCGRYRKTTIGYRIRAMSRRTILSVAKMMQHA